MELKEVLEKLLDQGKISKQDITDIIGTSEEMKQLTDMLHLLLCIENHDTECTYPQEELFEESWQGDAHVRWLERTQEFLIKHKLDDITGLSIIATATNLISAHTSPVLNIIADYINVHGDLVPEQSEPAPSELDPEPAQNDVQES